MNCSFNRQLTHKNRLKRPRNRSPPTFTDLTISSLILFYYAGAADEEVEKKVGDARTVFSIARTARHFFSFFIPPGTSHPFRCITTKYEQRLRLWAVPFLFFCAPPSPRHSSCHHLDDFKKTQSSSRWQGETGGRWDGNECGFARLLFPVGALRITFFLFFSAALIRYAHSCHPEVVFSNRCSIPCSFLCSGDNFCWQEMVAARLTLNHFPSAFDFFFFFFWWMLMINDERL